MKAAARIPSTTRKRIGSSQALLSFFSSPSLGLVWHVTASQRGHRWRLGTLHLILGAFPRPQRFLSLGLCRTVPSTRSPPALTGGEMVGGSQQRKTAGDADF